MKTPSEVRTTESKDGVGLPAAKRCTVQEFLIRASLGWRPGVVDCSFAGNMNVRRLFNTSMAMLCKASRQELNGSNSHPRSYSRVRLIVP